MCLSNRQNGTDCLDNWPWYTLFFIALKSTEIKLFCTFMFCFITSMYWRKQTLFFLKKKKVMWTNPWMCFLYAFTLLHTNPYSTVNIDFGVVLQWAGQRVHLLPFCGKWTHLLWITNSLPLLTQWRRNRGLVSTA